MCRSMTKPKHLQPPKPVSPQQQSALEVSVMTDAMQRCLHEWREESPVALPVSRQRLFASHQARVCLTCGSVHTRLWMVHGVATEWTRPTI